MGLGGYRSVLVKCIWEIPVDQASWTGVKSPTNHLLGVRRMKNERNNKNNFVGIRIPRGNISMREIYFLMIPH
jgi:hypothetical protein